MARLSDEQLLGLIETPRYAESWDVKSMARELLALRKVADPKAEWPRTVTALWAVSKDSGGILAQIIREELTAAIDAARKEQGA